jgi:hypothetical protein
MAPTVVPRPLASELRQLRISVVHWLTEKPMPSPWPTV